MAKSDKETEHPISALDADHYHSAGAVQRLMRAIVARLSHPGILMILVPAIIAWVLVNAALGHRAPDPPPFNWLQGAASVAALFMTVLILTTQRHDDELARHRDQLTLELVIVAERKIAKIIQLLEEMRRDNPMVENRIDHTATAMAQQADPGAVLDAIKDAQRSVTEKKG